MKSVLDLIAEENGKFIVQTPKRYEFKTKDEAYQFIRYFLLCIPYNN